jgi:hypothetical protein
MFEQTLMIPVGDPKGVTLSWVINCEGHQGKEDYGQNLSRCLVMGVSFSIS